jgi:phosphonoacetaldehyde hydrolase
LRLLNPALPPNTVRASRLQAVVLDWAGTTVDFGSVAPARTLQTVFGQFGILLSDDDARRDMGLPKKDHIRAILASPQIREAWQTHHNQAPGEATVEQIYELFIPFQLFCLAERSALLPGVLEAVQSFRRRGLKIGSTTGYTRAMLDLLLEQSSRAGYTPDCSLAPEDVGAGRPHPFMLYETAVRLQVYPMAAIAKIGDTPADIQEALNAGSWAIGVAATGNGIGLAFDEFQKLSPSEKELRLARSRAELQNAGAHFVIDTLGEVNALLDDIDARLASAART